MSPTNLHNLLPKILRNDEEGLKEAARLLGEGEVVAFPTETVYGLGVNLFCPKAINKLFHLKRRSYNKPFTAHICSLDQIYEISKELPEEFFLLAKHFFPGPLTLVVKKNSKISDLVTAGMDTIGIRMPLHETASQLIRYADMPIAATSANISGENPLKGEELRSAFPHIAAIIEGGEEPEGIASTVLSLINPKEPCLLRQGSISMQQILNVLNCKSCEM